MKKMINVLLLVAILGFITVNVGAEGLSTLAGTEILFKLPYEH